MVVSYVIFFRRNIMTYDITTMSSFEFGETSFWWFSASPCGLGPKTTAFFFTGLKEEP